MSTIVVEVWGDFACFTRPETKVERFSYPVMTPSAARGVLDAIYAKPVEFSWRVNKIEVLKPVQFIALRRNEVKEKISERAIVTAFTKGGELDPVIADTNKELSGTDAKGRTQRQTIALKDVRYRIHAHIKPRSGLGSKQKAIEEQALRRISKGKCFYQPYLGCREFTGYFALADSDKQIEPVTMEIGWMVYDVFDIDMPVIDAAAPFVSIFRAQLVNGVMEIPPWESNMVIKPR